MKIAIGALGGSGTRSVAQIFVDLGFDMGSSLNSANDNLLFTAIFKSPYWYKKSNKNDRLKRLMLFDNISNKKLRINELYNYFSINSKFSKKDRLKFLLNKISSKSSDKKGFKEPNSHIYLEELLKFYPNLKFYFVMRHGLDMAFSNNMQQLKNWGFLFNLDFNNNLDYANNRNQLDYWIKSSQRMRAYQQQFPNNIFIINHTEFYLNPKKVIDQILTFSDIKPSKEIKEKLYQIPREPSSSGRYKKHNLNIFNTAQLEAVEQLGFKI